MEIVEGGGAVLEVNGFLWHNYSLSWGGGNVAVLELLWDFLLLLLLFTIIPPHLVS